MNDAGSEKGKKLTLADKLLMQKEEGQQGSQHNQLFDMADAEETVSQMFFDPQWRDVWSVDFRQLVFGPRIGAGGFGEVSHSLEDVLKERR